MGWSVWGGYNMEKTQEEFLADDLTALIWPLLDDDMSKEEIELIYRNVIDSWKPKKADS
jgi:hypothetical protein